MPKPRVPRLLATGDTSLAGLGDQRPVTFGAQLDEMVRRATGNSTAHHVRTLIAEPPGADMLTAYRRR